MSLFGSPSPFQQDARFPMAPYSPDQSPVLQAPAGMFGAQKPGFNEAGGWGDKLGQLGALLLSYGGNPAGTALMQDRMQQRREDIAQKRLDMQMNRPVVQSTGNGGFAVLNPVTGQVITQQAGTPAPHYWETNDGSLAAVGPDGKPQIVYKDPTPKINWITADNGDGTKSVIPVGPNGPMTGAGMQPQGASALPPGYSVRKKGGAPSGAPGFR